MDDKEAKKKRWNKQWKRKTPGPPGSPFYFFGMIGALVYWLQVADGFWPVVFAFVKALFWPGFFVYEVLKFIAS